MPQRGSARGRCVVRVFEAAVFFEVAVFFEAAVRFAFLRGGLGLASIVPRHFGAPQRQA